MSTIEEARAHLGDAVIYVPSGGGPLEEGVITGTSQTMVFVRYAGDAGSKATNPSDLALVTEPETRQPAGTPEGEASE
jgi:hypothetical protein